MSAAKGSQRSQEPAGSPEVGEPAFVVIGKLRRPHGLLGEIFMEVLTDFPERIQPGMVVFIDEDHQPERIRNCRRHKEGLLIAFEGCGGPECAGVFRNRMVYIETDTIPDLPEGEYYHHQIIGMRAVLESGEHFGVVTVIFESGAHDICVVRMENGEEVLLPVIDAVIPEVELAKKQIVVRLMPGLLPDSQDAAL